MRRIHLRVTLKLSLFHYLIDRDLLDFHVGSVMSCHSRVTVIIRAIGSDIWLGQPRIMLLLTSLQSN